MVYYQLELARPDRFWPKPTTNQGIPRQIPLFLTNTQAARLSNRQKTTRLCAKALLHAACLLCRMLLSVKQNIAFIRHRLPKHARKMIVRSVGAA